MRLNRNQALELIKTASPRVREQLEAIIAKVPKGSKLGNIKIKTLEGVFDSLGEYGRWNELKLLRRAGEIRNLKRQVEFVVKVRGRKTFSWFADFTYEERDVDGCWIPIVEDFKGFRTDVYRLKKKVVEATFGFTIRETGVKKAVQQKRRIYSRRMSKQNA